MKAPQDLKNNSVQGESTFDRSYTTQNNRLKETGVSSASGQRSAQTSGKGSTYKSMKKAIL